MEKNLFNPWYLAIYKEVCCYIVKREIVECYVKKNMNIHSFMICFHVKIVIIIEIFLHFFKN